MSRFRLGLRSRFIAFNLLLVLFISGCAVAIGHFFFLRPLGEEGRLVSRAFEHRGTAAELQDLIEMRKRFGLTVTVFAPDGHVFMTAADKPPPPLASEQVMRLERDRSFELAPGVGVLAVIERGKFLAYVIVEGSPFAVSIRNALVSLLVAILFVMVVSIPLSRWVLRPLSDLTHATQSFPSSSGVRVLAKRDDELGDLARSFNGMADRIETMRRNEKQLLANVSHELRTPLARISVLLELAAEASPERIKSIVPDIAHDLRELQRLIDDVLTAARLDLAEGRVHATEVPLQWTSIAAWELIERSCERFRRLHGDRLMVERSDNLPMLRCDPVLLHRVFDNLLDNAARYSPPGTVVVLRASDEGGALLVSIVDHGRGVSEEDQKQLFEPFFRADRGRERQTGGIGLGLSLSKRIVEAHGGTIQFESRLGTGTCVTVRLPATFDLEEVS